MSSVDDFIYNFPHLNPVWDSIIGPIHLPLPKFCDSHSLYITHLLTADQI